mmetsp:Transcript_39598/g.92616  ORF Transcript_39598/g.92616 Transcript_39598/m.92616 type:complete len:228 (+) Transcript_39598:1313-1996(+)
MASADPRDQTAGERSEDAAGPFSVPDPLRRGAVLEVHPKSEIGVGHLSVSVDVAADARRQPSVPARAGTSVRYRTAEENDGPQSASGGNTGPRPGRESQMGTAAAHSGGRAETVGQKTEKKRVAGSFLAVRGRNQGAGHGERRPDPRHASSVSERRKGADHGLPLAAVSGNFQRTLPGGFEGTGRDPEPDGGGASSFGRGGPRAQSVVRTGVCRKEYQFSTETGRNF